LRWLSAAALLGLPAILMGPLAMTLDRTRWMAVKTLIELLVRLPLVWLGAVHFGIPGAIAGSAIATAGGTVAALFIVRWLIGARLTPQLMTLSRPLVAMLPAGALLWLAEPMVMAAPGLVELLARAVPVGVLYLLVYACLVVLAWRLAGRPPGVEQHLLDTIRARFKAARAPRSNPMEAHAKQPH
jgi:hypothetical protein